MIRLEEIERMIRADGPLVFDGEKRRLVRLEVNTAGPCHLRLETGQDERFLANVNGRETLTFYVTGPAAVRCESKHEVWWWTPELESSAVVVKDPVVFTKVMNRRERNPEIERMARKLQENAERRMARMLAEFERRQAAMMENVRGSVEPRPGAPKPVDGAATAGGAGEAKPPKPPRAKGADDEAEAEGVADGD